MDHDRDYQRLAYRIFADFGASIAVPVVLAAFLGKRLDSRFETAPFFLVGCFVLAFAITAFSIVKKARQYQKEYVAIEKKP